MKPKDLKKLFSFEQRRPALEDQIFYVPIYYTDYEAFQLPHFSQIFGNENPCCVEYCSGNGDWIIERAKRFPEKNWIAVERRFDRVRKIWSKMKNSHLSNLLIVSGEAEPFTEHYLRNGILEEVYINFSDPWPKVKHAKNRLLNTVFLNQLCRVLTVGKTVTFVTDDATYLSQTLNLFQKHARFLPALPAPYYVTEWPDYGDSWFEALWRERGKTIHYTQFYTNES